MTSAQTRLAEQIEAFYGAADRTSDGAIASHAYKQSVTELDAVIGRELVRITPLSVVRYFESYEFKDAPYRNTIMEPVGKMNAYFPIINDQINKRNKKVCLPSYRSVGSWVNMISV